MTRAWKPYIEIDCIKRKILPAGWVDDIHECIERYSQHTILSSARSELSREIDPDHVSIVDVVLGQDCVAQLNWLEKLYKTTFIEIIRDELGRAVYPSTDVRSSININCINKVGHDYESHIDTNPITGLLFACEASEDSGGQLIFEREDGTKSIVNPKLGHFLAFDARDIPHYVTPLKNRFRRISIPMNYYDSANNQSRPAQLDEYLYGV